MTEVSAPMPARSAERGEPHGEMSPNRLSRPGSWNSQTTPLNSYRPSPDSLAPEQIVCPFTGKVFSSCSLYERRAGRVQVSLLGHRPALWLQEGAVAPALFSNTRQKEGDSSLPSSCKPGPVSFPFSQESPWPNSSKALVRNR